MTPEERAEKFENQVKELYALVGEYATKFEHVCMAMRNGIIFPMHANGLTNQDMSRAVSAELTAWPLLNAFRSIMLCQRPLSDADRTILKLVCTRVQKCIEDRNDLLHGTLFIGWAGAEETDFSTASGFKEKNKRSGLEATNLTVSESALRPKIDELKTLEKLVNRVWVAVVHGTPLEKALVLHNGTVDLPPGA